MRVGLRFVATYIHLGLDHFFRLGPAHAWEFLLVGNQYDNTQQKDKV
jgi:hypothetical protein